MCLSHGIGPDNIDIVMTELDALANVDFATREVKKNHRTLTLVRIGTSGALQPRPYCRHAGYCVLLDRF